MHALPNPGDLICGGQYRLLSLIGRGGMGAVYEARDLRINRRVAIKLLLEPDSAALERFSREARVLAVLNHPAVLPIHAFHPDDPLGPLIVTQFLEGKDLSKVLAAPMPSEQAVDLILCVCSGLFACHRRKILHRDIKPSNVFMLDNPNGWSDRIKLIDFGLALPLNAPLSVHVTGIGVVPGTPRWTAPELFCHAEPTTLSDQYSVAALLYNALAGQSPYHDSHGPLLQAAIASGAYRPLSSVTPGIAPGLVHIVHKALSFEPSNRFENLNLFATELLAYAPPSTLAHWEHHFTHTAQPIDARLYEPVSRHQPPICLPPSPATVRVLQPFPPDPYPAPRPSPQLAAARQSLPHLPSPSRSAPLANRRPANEILPAVSRFSRRRYRRLLRLLRRISGTSFVLGAFVGSILTILFVGIYLRLFTPGQAALTPYLTSSPQTQTLNK